ncbi:MULTISPECIES: hypothetical protein [Pseudomonas]|uniref:hypothetical protein n=1 Tax=Pseudomonas TaxID=286 RepID=UPI001CBFBF2C|nr:MULTISPECIES: hypothetical protein [Pseudomonas]
MANTFHNSMPAQSPARTLNNPSGAVSYYWGGTMGPPLLKWVIDRDGKTLPVRLTTDANEEKPAMGEGSSTRPASAKVNLTVTVSGLKPGVPYNLYRYDSFDNVPESGFNAKASKAEKHWEIDSKEGSTYVLKETIRSDQVAVYRAVPVTVP